MDLGQYEQTVYHTYGLKIIEPLELGYNSDALYRVSNGRGIMFVLKIATTMNSIREIRMNLQGYENLERIGLKRFIPAIVASEINDDFAMILMEDCGPNYLSQARESTDPISLYQRTAAELKEMYTISRREGHEGQQMLEGIIALIIEQYDHYIQKTFDPCMAVVSQLQLLPQVIRAERVSSYCFSNWDFTPEDIYMTPQGLKYSDPHAEVLGVPIVDLACLAGLVRLYDLPEAEAGARLFEEMAYEYIPTLLSLTSATTKRVFNLGRLLQCFLSARFRLATHPAQAREIFRVGVAHLERLL